MKTIDGNQYYYVVGLLTTLHNQAKLMKEIEKTLANLLGEEDDHGYFGHVSDAAYDPNMTADELLRLLDIEVV